MASAYTNVAFSSRQPDQETAVKLNKLRDDLSTAIAAAGGGTSTGDMLKSVYDTNANGKVDTCDSVPWGSISGKPATFPPDSTAMLKSVYDTNADNIVDQAGAVPWAGITSKPATFPPDATAELIARKGAANGYPSLDATTLVPIAQLPAPTSGDATATQLAKGNDSRLTNARAPTAHHTTHEHGGSDLVSVTYADLLAVPGSFNPSVHAPTHKSGGTDSIKLDELAAPTDITTLNASTTAHGLLPKLAGGTLSFLRSDGTWAAPAGGGDMTKAVYDTNADNIVDQAAAAPWTGITGKPATFAPDLTAIWKGFIAKSAAYTLTTADSGKYVICSGGSWTLTLPVPAAGLVFQVRNDMGISGTTGTITLSPTGGTIDALASIPLLAQQECTLITDGTNWRTFGLKREVILGVQDLSSAVSGTILLPVGYRYFELTWTDLVPVVNGDNMNAQVSVNGGSSWFTSANYYTQVVYNNAAATPAAVANAGVAYWWMGSSGANIPAAPGASAVKLYPGDASNSPTFIGQSGGYFGTGSYYTLWNFFGSINSPQGIVNALKYYMASGNISSSKLTVKGIV